MKITLTATIFIIINLSVGSTNIFAANGHTSNRAIKLTPDLLNLLREEMREISIGVNRIAVSLATADWKSIHSTSEKIRASYIMEKKLTPAQSSELTKALPEQFKLLDTEFHQRAEKLGTAAAAHDTELVVFHYSRLLESCTLCHSAFASERFPGFALPTPQDHHH